MILANGTSAHAIKHYTLLSNKLIMTINIEEKFSKQSQLLSVITGNYRQLIGNIDNGLSVKTSNFSCFWITVTVTVITDSHFFTLPIPLPIIPVRLKKTLTVTVLPIRFPVYHPQIQLNIPPAILTNTLHTYIHTKIYTKIHIFKQE